MTALLQTDPTLPRLPTEDDLPDTDHQPVDNELQLLVPFLLQAILLLAWAERQDWFMGVNLGLYHTLQQPPIGPDAFLALGVERVRAKSKLRKSYVVWQEKVMPQWVLEVVSQKPGGEYERDRKRRAKQGKLFQYAQLGVQYYTIYNPNHWRRDKHEPFEVYQLVNGVYVRQPGNPVWMPELGLGIGTAQGTHKDYTREWLYWYDQQGKRYPAPENILEQTKQRIEEERQRAEREQWRRAQEQQRADREQQLREQAQTQLVQEQQRVEREQQRAEREQQLREQAERRAEQLAERLRALDIDPDELT